MSLKKKLYSTIIEFLRKGFLIYILQGGVSVQVSSNLSALNSFNRVTKNKGVKSELTEKISTGKRIVRAADDAAGLAISESMKAQIRGMSMAEKNIQDGISLIQVTEGAMDEIDKVLNRMKEMAVQASNDTLTDEDRNAIEQEFSQLKDNIDTISRDTEFNGINLLGEDKGITLQIKDTPYITYEVQLKEISTNTLGIKDANITTREKASEANEKIDEALNRTISHRTNLGVSMNRLQHSYNDAQNLGSNLSKSLSGIEDIDMATALMGSIKEKILVDYNQSMLSVAKQDNEKANVILNKWLSY